jgi:hypothetical protein
MKPEYFPFNVWIIDPVAQSFLKCFVKLGGFITLGLWLCISHHGHLLRKWNNGLTCTNAHLQWHEKRTKGTKNGQR